MSFPINQFQSIKSIVNIVNILGWRYPKEHFEHALDKLFGSVYFQKRGVWLLFIITMFYRNSFFFF